MSSIYEYLFSQDSLVVRYKGVECVIVPGMRCHVKSKRLGEWCPDGIVKSIFKSGLYVTYGHRHYFSAFTRGNCKWIPLESITSELRFPEARCLKPVLKADLVDDSEDSLPS